MDRSEADELALEMLDPDLPNVTSAERPDGSTFCGSFSREFVETDEMVGSRSVFLCARVDADKVATDERLIIDGETYFARYTERRGRVISAVVLGQ